MALRLVVTGATCEECILPRPLLEDIATGILQRTVPEMTSVSIEDPARTRITPTARTEGGLPTGPLRPTHPS